MNSFCFSGLGAPNIYVLHVAHNPYLSGNVRKKKSSSLYMHQVLQKHISFDHHTSPCYDPGELQVPMKPLRPGEPVYRKLRACHLGSLGKNEFSSVCHSKCTLYIYIIYIYMICILTSKASWWHWEWWFHCETCLRNW